MKRISVSKSPTTAPSTCETSSTNLHPPTDDAWPLISLSAYQRVPSPKSLAWAGPYANGRTPSWPTSTQPEPATHPTEAINGHYRTRQTRRQRLPQPHQLPAPNAPHRRRSRCLHPHSTLKSYFTRSKSEFGKFEQNLHAQSQRILSSCMFSRYEVTNAYRRDLSYNLDSDRATRTENHHCRRAHLDAYEARSPTTYDMQP